MDEAVNQPSTSVMLPSQPQTSTPKRIQPKTMKMPDPPEYVVYSDSELDMVRSQYFELLRSGKERQCKMSRELLCRLIRNTVTSMVAILRASCSGQEQMYPSKNEIQAMAQKIIDYYPMLRDSADMPYVSAFSLSTNVLGFGWERRSNDSNISFPQLTVYSKMYKRVQNIKSPRKRQGRMPQRGVQKRSLFEPSPEDESELSTPSTDVSLASTILLPESDDGNDELSPGMPMQK